MMVYTENLYENIIKEPANYFDCLKVISGFASSKFLKRVVKDFPNHRICLIIGMAINGISITEHQEFKNICSKFENVEVFYKVENPPNHMKLYQWYNDEVPGVSFIGSANFSESAFFFQEEVLSSTLDVFSNLIDKVILQSISCLDKQVEDKILLYEDSDRKILESEGEVYGYLDARINNIRNKNKLNTKNEKINLKKFLLNNIPLTAYNHVNIELILKDDPHWKTRALNNWNRNNNSKDDSYIDIERTNRLGIKKLDFFQRDINVQLISDDKIEWTVKREGEYGRELRTIAGMSFYEYFKARLGISENRPISYDDFYNYGRTNLSLYKLNDTEYYLDFSVSTKH